jgi:DNA repair protein SbcC/Rad50
MNPLRLKLRNLRSFRELELVLPEGRTAILGANGAGKSTLASAVDWALFGPDSRSWAPYLTQGAEGTELLLELEFEHGDAVYRVRRGFSGRGSGKATLDLDLREPDTDPDDFGWSPLTRETAKQTQELIEELLGLSRETFRASAMLYQGDGGAFTEAAPASRKRILSKILGLERWQGYLEQARVDIRTVEQRQAVLSARLEQALPEIESKQETADQVAELGKLAAQVELVEAAARTELAEHQRLIRDATQLAASRAVANARLLQAETRIAGIDQLTRDADTAEAGQAEVVEALAGLNAHRFVGAQERWTYLSQEIQKANAERTARRSQRYLLEQTAETQALAADALVESAERARDEDSPAGVCSLCGQPLSTQEAREHLAAELEQQAAQARAIHRQQLEQIAAIAEPEEDPLPELERLLAEQQTLLDAANQVSLERARLEERGRSFQAAIDKRPTADAVKEAERAHQEAAEALDALPAASDPAAVGAATAASERLEAELPRYRVELDQARGTLARLDERLRRIGELEEQTKTDRAELDSSLERLALLRILERAYGRDGIPAWIVSQVAIPTLEAEATRIVGELGAPYRIELRTERLTAGGEQIDALDVIVETEDGERPYETFSGGERTRINLALRISLARLLANRARAESRLLVIDEPEFLDGEGTAALVAVIAGLSDFSKVWLISHVPALRDAAQLDGALEVVRDADGWSVLTV